MFSNARFSDDASLFVNAGDDTLPAVVCSATATYALKAADTSNTVLVVRHALDENASSWNVAASVTGYLECRRIAPDREQLRTRLSFCAISSANTTFLNVAFFVFGGGEKRDTLS